MIVNKNVLFSETFFSLQITEKVFSLMQKQYINASSNLCLFQHKSLKTLPHLYIYILKCIEIYRKNRVKLYALDHTESWHLSSNLLLKIVNTKR